MTTLNHAAQSAIIQYLIYPKWYFIVLAVLLGTFGDLIRLFQKDKNDWTDYEIAHEFIWYNLIVPYHNLHILEDWLIHDHERGGWKLIGIYIEMLFWFLIVLYCFYNYIL